ncbi:membrane-bound lytic murein transglycosylase MltF [Marinicellulosiphila megalodicopiae]|uniref:membrane-bound lytic murein transglycosylase MltF n=1 Tax=Marinicellulosiphila megalodicopiae TaxID=2724896 RepID=UPI003BAE1EC0
MIFKHYAIQQLSIFLFGVALLLGVLYLGYEKRNHLNEVTARQTLRIAVVVNPSVYWPESTGTKGFEFDLVERFAKSKGLKTHYQVVDTREQLLRAINLDTADIAMSGHTVMFNQKKPIGYASYLDKNHLDRSQTTLPIFPAIAQVLYHSTYLPQGSEINNIEQLQGLNITVAKGSPYSKLVEVWKQQWPEIKWHELEGHSIDLMKLLDEGLTDIVILPSTEVRINEVYFPDLDIAFDATDELPIVWELGIDRDSSLRISINNFILEMKNSGELNVMIERYFGHLDQGPYYVNPVRFEKLIKSRLTQYLPLFQKSAADNGLDWRLLAAISHQESHWRTNAISPTGVRGLMMLTRATAKDMGFDNRIKPENSIEGGARYLKSLKRRLSDEIVEPDRTWFTLASYNVGMGHVNDARKICEALEKNPNSWLDVMECLPLLSDPKWYKDTTYGKARGNEPVTYVQNIRQYYDLLKWHFGEELEIESNISKPQIEISVPSGL